LNRIIIKVVDFQVAKKLTCSIPWHGIKQAV